MEDFSSERTYRIVGAQPYAMLAVLAILTAASPVAGIAWFWYFALFRAAYRIRVAGDGVEFRSLARRRRTPLGAVRSIRSRQIGTATIRFDGGRVDILGSLDGWHDFVNRVEAANPAVELSGV